MILPNLIKMKGFYSENNVNHMMYVFLILDAIICINLL